MIYRFYGKEIDLFIPEPGKKIGICMSGGLDSTILACLLLKHIPVEDIKVFTFDLTKSVATVKRIFQYWDIEPEHEILPNPGNFNGSLAPIMLEKAKTVDFLYTGINQNPPWADSIPDGEKPHRYKKHQHENIIMPFATLYKNDIVDLCYALGEDDMVMPFTYTCTESTTQSCGTCFACRERKWAFKEAGRQDIIKYTE